MFDGRPGTTSASAAGRPHVIWGGHLSEQLRAFGNTVPTERTQSLMHGIKRCGYPRFSGMLGTPTPWVLHEYAAFATRRVWPP
jgi:hypothetical protein